MLHFSHPELLLLALLLPPLAWWWIRWRRGAVRHPLAGALVQLPTLRTRLAFWGGLTLRMLGLACVIVAAANPRWPDMRTRIRTEGISIMMAIDVSGSMATKDFEWKGKLIARLDAVKEVFKLFVAGGEEGSAKLEGRPTDKVGLVVFGSLPETACPLTLSHSALLRAMKEQKPLKIPGESQTNVIDATIVALHGLRHDRSPRKVLVLLTDGEHNVNPPPSNWKLNQAVQAAKALGIPIYAIDAAGTAISDAEGNKPATSVEEREKAMRALRQLAEGTGGEYFRADHTEALLGVYQVIDRKERSSILSNQFYRYHEGYPYLAVTALVLFAAVIALETTWWRRAP